MTTETAGLQHRMAADEYEKIVARMDSQSLDEAIGSVSAFVREHPGLARAYNDLGVLYYKAGDKQFSLANYEKARRLAPQDATIGKNLAEYYLVELGWTDDAIFILTDLVGSNPNDIDLLSLLASISVTLERPREAEAFLRRILDLEPWNVQARDLLLGLSAIPRRTDAGPSADELLEKAQGDARDGSHVEAVASLEQVLLISPGNARAHNDLGVLYQRCGDLARAQAHHEAAVELDPSSPLFRKNLAELYYAQLGMTDKAIAIFARLLKDFPDDAEVLGALAMISRANDRPEEARIFLGRILELEPWNSDAGRMLAELNAPAETVAPVSAPASPSLPSGAGEAISNLRATIADMERTIKAPSHEEAANLAAGQLDAAIAELGGVLDRNPADARAHNDLGVLCHRRGDIQGSRKHYEEASRLDPANPVFRKNLADLYYAGLGMTDEAINLYVGLQKEYPADVEVLSALAIICIDNDRPREAGIYLKRVLELEPWNQQARELLQTVKSNYPGIFF